MNDETISAGAGSSFPTPQPSPAPGERGLAYWLKRLLACNPFYLVSAALLLFGMYRVSVDVTFLPTEIGQLVFNFSSLQFYELLLVGTAIMLARRCIWYDSGLLLVLENLFVLVPFLLISQAALIEQRIVWMLCIFTALLATGRWGAARGWISYLKVAPGLLVAGAVLLVTNAALVVIYRILHEAKVGTGIPSGAAYDMNEASWFWLLPTLCALAILLPRLCADGKLLVQRRWFPVSLFLVWLVGTGVHLYALGYIYDFPLRRELIAPTLCVLAWALHLRLTDFLPTPGWGCRIVTTTLPLLAALPAAGVAGKRVFFGLMVLNALGFLGVVLTQREHRLARHLLFASLSLGVAALPPEWARWLGMALSWEKFLFLAAAVYLLLCAVLSRNPKIALPAAFAAAAMGAALRLPHDDVFHWAAQAGLVFFLLHSLRWEDFEHPGAPAVRIFMTALWVIHAIIWVRDGAPFWQLLAPAALVAAGWWFRGFVFRNWSGVALPIASAIVGVAQPMNYALVKLHGAPSGVTAIAASFLLFAIGTTVALTKHRWHPHREQ